MKRFYLLLLLLCAVFACSATNVGHFFYNVADEKISADNVSAAFGKWFNLDEETSFVKERDYTDDLGIRHQNYCQYFGGIKVDDAMVMVHSKDGIVTSVNGCVAEAGLTPDASIAELRSAADYSYTMVIVKKTTDEGSKFVLARKVYDTEKDATIYIDAQTGEVISEIPNTLNYSATESAQTYYNEAQTITCDYDEEGKYYKLIDETRNIYTYDATYIDPTDLNTFITNYYNSTYSTEEEITSAATAATDALLNSCSDFQIPDLSTSSATSGDRLYNVKLEATPDSSWWKILDDSKMQIYISVYDNNGSRLYKSGYITDETLPHSFSTISRGIEISGSDYRVRFYNYDPDAENDYGGYFIISDEGEGTYTWSKTNTKGEYRILNLGKPAVQAHWAMEKTYDFYKSVFSRESYDGNGSNIIQFVSPLYNSTRFSSVPNNASARSWLGTIKNYLFPYMYYGMGDGVKYNPFISLDIVGHEFTHLVTKYNGNGGLTSSGESGALNEGFSDIFGYCIKNYTLGATDYILSEEVMIYYSNQKSLKDPKSNKDGTDPFPDTYGGEYWLDPTASYDHGGVHANSGVLSKWFYLLCEGGSGTNDLGNSYQVTGIGIEKARSIAYRTVMTYLTSSATYSDARNSSLTSATDLYDEKSTEYIAVMNAWYAVGVGDKYDPGQSTNDTDDENISVYAAGKTIYVNCPSAKTITIYGIDGAPLYKEDKCESLAFPAPAKGFYIVQAGSESVKLGVN